MEVVDSMIISANGFLMNDASTGVWIDEDLTGLELPPLRTTTGSYAGRDGGFVGPQFYDPRAISIVGMAFAQSSSGLETTRRSFQAALQGKTITLQVTTNAGNAYVIYCNLVSFSMPIKRSNLSAPFKLDLVAADPTIYDNATGTALTASVARYAPGGYTYPVVYPVTYAAGAGDVTVTNAGTTAVYPVVTITVGSACTNPTITNNTINRSVGLTLVCNPGDVIVIDMSQRTVTLNGGNVYSLLTSTSAFWYLQPGGNAIRLTSLNVTDSVSAVVSWRSGYSGI